MYHILVWDYHGCRLVLLSRPLKSWTYEFINYDKLPQLSPVDACERQGSRMGDTQAWENLVARILSDHFLGLIKCRTCLGPWGVQCNIQYSLIQTTSFEDSGLSLFYKHLGCKGFFFPDKIAHLCSFRQRLPLPLPASPCSLPSTLTASAVYFCPWEDTDHNCHQAKAEGLFLETALSKMRVGGSSGVGG